MIISKSTEYSARPSNTSRDFLRDNASIKTSSFQGERCGQLKILIVDDHPIVLKALHSLFQDLGYTPDTAMTGEEAVVKAAHGYDLIFMDIGLPGINGLEAVYAIRKREKKKPAYIIVLTAHVSEKIEKEALSVGANLVVSKPIEQSKIKEILALWM